MNAASVYTIKLDPEPIGSGAYGSVYSARDQSGNKYAVKKIKMGKGGLENIIEPVIMSSLRYRYLASAISILATRKSLYILTELADADMAQVTRRSSTKKNPKIAITESSILQWCFQLALAVYCLHSNSIIHGDIKAANCLLFNSELRVDDISQTDSNKR